MNFRCLLTVVLLHVISVNSVLIVLPQLLNNDMKQGTPEFPDAISYLITVDRTPLELKLHKNRILFGDKYYEQGEPKKPINCYYQGVTQTEGNTKVVVSLCYGIEGTIQLQDRLFEIAPLQRPDGVVSPLEIPTIPHKIQPLIVDSSELRSLHCPVGGSTRTLQSTGTLPDTSNRLRIVQLIVFNDKTRYKKFGSKTTHNTAEILNYVNDFFAVSLGNRLQIRLVAQVMWEKDDPLSALQFTTTTSEPPVNSDYLLQQFLDLTGQSAYMKNLPLHSHVQLFSNRQFAGSIIGLANEGHSCDTISGGICAVNRETTFLNAIISAHELLHLLNVKHDDGTLLCPFNGFIMSPYANSNSGFSTCTTNDISGYLPSVPLSCMPHVQF